MTVGRELDRLVATALMGFQRWRIVRSHAVPPDHVGPAPEDPQSARFVLLTEAQAREDYTDYAFENGYIRLADEDTPPFSDFDRYVPCYSTDINQAMAVLCKARELGRLGMMRRGFLIDVCGQEVDGREVYRCQIFAGPAHWVTAKGHTICEAICQAALVLVADVGEGS